MCNNFRESIDINSYLAVDAAEFENVYLYFRLEKILNALLYSCGTQVCLFYLLFRMNKHVLRMCTSSVSPLPLTTKI